MRSNISNSVENNVQEVETMKANTVNNKGAETMNNNTEKETATMSKTNVSKVAMMPKEELAVTDNLKLMIPNMPSFSSLVLPDETAEELDGKKNSIVRYRELGFFSPIRGMVNISNRLDGKINAKLHEDEKGQRNIEYVQEYVNGSYSPKMSLPQASMRIAAQHDFSSKGIKEPKVRNKVANFILDATEDYYGKFCGVLVDELDITNILKVLYEALPHLPFSTDKLTGLEEETVYQLVDFHINNLPSWSVKEHKSYYALEESDIETLASNMEMKKLDLLKMLKRYDFLYLTPSSKGYQTNVRIKGRGEDFTAWRYCIYKFSYFAKIEEDTSSVIKPGDNF